MIYESFPAHLNNKKKMLNFAIGEDYFKSWRTKTYLQTKTMHHGK